MKENLQLDFGVTKEDILVRGIKGGGKYAPLVRKFIASGEEAARVMGLQQASKSTLNSTRQCLNDAIKKLNYQTVAKAVRRNNEVYLMRIDAT
jgi:hypothetical protein